jgi:mono/diheme cytochrome c family protein
MSANRPSVRAVGLPLLLAGALTACAGGGAPFARGDAGASPADRGRALAMGRCAGCHAVAPGMASGRPNAPPFAQLGLRFTGIGWERAMAEIARGGHEDMPPTRLDPSEIADLSAYVQSLR